MRSTRLLLLRGRILRVLNPCSERPHCRFARRVPNHDDVRKGKPWSSLLQVVDSSWQILEASRLVTDREREALRELGDWDSYREPIGFLAR